MSRYTGGITILAIDQDALDEYSQATGSDTNLDEFMARMTRDVIPDKVRKRCSVEVSHVRNTTQVSVLSSLHPPPPPPPPFVHIVSWSGMHTYIILNIQYARVVHLDLCNKVIYSFLQLQLTSHIACTKHTVVYAQTMS